MTPAVTKLTAGHVCQGQVEVDKWSRLPGEKKTIRQCKFSAHWRIDGKNFCTRHGGDLVLNLLAAEEKPK